VHYQLHSLPYYILLPLHYKMRLHRIPVNYKPSTMEHLKLIPHLTLQAFGCSICFISRIKCLKSVPRMCTLRADRLTWCVVYGQLVCYGAWETEMWLLHLQAWWSDNAEPLCGEVGLMFLQASEIKKYEYFLCNHFKPDVFGL
jgi:hypothetical protein